MWSHFCVRTAALAGWSAHGGGVTIRTPPAVAVAARIGPPLPGNTVGPAG